MLYRTAEARPPSPEDEDATPDEWRAPSHYRFSILVSPTRAQNVPNPSQKMTQASRCRLRSATSTVAPTDSSLGIAVVEPTFSDARRNYWRH